MTDGFLAEPYLARGWQTWLGTVPELVRGADASQIVVGRGTRRIRMEHDGQHILVTHYSSAVRWEWLARGPQPCNAERAFEHAGTLGRAGMATPEPVGWLQGRGPGPIRESYYVALDIRAVCDATDFSQNLSVNWAPQVRLTGAALGRMHQAGILPRGLDPENLVFADQGPGSLRLHLMDPLRLRFGWIGIHAGVWNVLRLRIPHRYLSEFLRAYAEGRGIPLELCLRVHARIRWAHEAVRRKSGE